jgi:hypothetical protein
LILAHMTNTTDYEHGANGTSSTSYSPRLLLAILEPTVGPAHADREDEVEFLVERGRVGSACDPRVFLGGESESIELSANWGTALARARLLTTAICSDPFVREVGNPPRSQNLSLLNFRLSTRMRRVSMSEPVPFPSSISFLVAEYGTTRTHIASCNQESTPCYTCESPRYNHHDSSSCCPTSSSSGRGLWLGPSAGSKRWCLDHP